MPEVEEKRGGVVIGPEHNADGTPGGGRGFVLDTGKHIEEEGQEINIPIELRQSKQIFTFTGSNADVLEQILKLAGLSLSDHVTNVRAGDIVICVRSAWDPTIRTYTGTIEEILHLINTSNGCKPITPLSSPVLKEGGAIPELNSKGGYDYSGAEEEIADKAGLVTLPETIAGTNCSSCIFNQNGFCDNAKVLLPVTSKMCCSYWDDKSFRSHITNIWKANFFADKSKEFPLNDRGGYDYSGKALDNARDADLITLPPGIEGTNCAAGNCMYREKGMCVHPKINLPVTDRMSCALWDNTEVIRPWGAPVEIQFGEGGPIPAKGRKKDWQAENPNSPRWKKKKESLQELSNSIHRLRLKVNKDMQSEDERTALTALVVAVMDRSAERIGNDDSADNGHFGVTGFRKDHIKVVGNKVLLDYVGKAGTKHDKSISDIRISKALKKAIKNAPGKFVFETSDGFRIKSDKVTRFLEPFNISPKAIRGYNANKWIIDLLKKADGKWQLFSDNPKKARKERKKIFNKAVKETAQRVGHGAATLKKHYMIPELPIQYIEHGKIIDMKNIGYYKDGGPLGDLQAADYFANPNEVPDIVNKKTEEIYLEAQDEGIDKIFNAQEVKTVDWKDVVPTQDFLRSSKFNKLENVEDIYSINLPWAIEYNGKYYINDGHHRAVAMYNRKQPVKIHAYPIDESTKSDIMDYQNEIKKGVEVEKEHKNLYLEIKKRLHEIGVEMPISENEFYTEIAKVHIKEKKDYYDLLDKYIEKYSLKEGGPISSTEEKIAERLKQRQKGKEFKDTGVATYTRKYQAAYDIVTSSDLADIEKDNVTAYKLIEKSKIWPPYNVNELKEQGNTSGAAYMKVKCREFLSPRPLDSKEARSVYVRNIEKLRSALESIKTASDVKNYLDHFADLDTFDLGDLSSLPTVSYKFTTAKGNLANHSSNQVEEYFDNIFGKKFYNFCRTKSETARRIFAEAILYESYSQSMRDARVNEKYQIIQGTLKRYEELLSQIQVSSGDQDQIRQLINQSGVRYYEYDYTKPFIVNWLTKYIDYLRTETKEKIASSLSPAYTVREDDWSWSGAEKKAAAATKDEEGKPRKPQNIFEKYGIEVPKVLKRTPLDFVKRTGGLKIGDVSTAAVLDNYGFKNIIYGNYVNDAESKEHTKHILGAMLDMMEICNINIKDINKLGGLDINIGSTGCGPFSSASACYFPSLKAINLTKKRGDGSLGHEWSHYLDNTLAEGTEKRATNIQYATLNPAKSERVTMLFSEYKNWLLNGGTLRKIKVTYYPQKKFLYRIFGETLPEAIEAIQKRFAAYKDYKNFDSNDLIRYYGYLAYKMNDNKPLEVELETKATQFYVGTSQYIPTDYFLNPKEMFARAFEGWLEYKLEKMGRSSNYLVDIKSGMGSLSIVIPQSDWCYPSGPEVVWLDDWFERLFSAIRVDYNIKPFTWGTKERVDEYTDYKDTKNEKVDAGVEVATDSTVTVTGEIEQFEKGYGFRIATLKDAKGANRNIYRLITNPYNREEGFAVGGVQSDVFIFASKYFTDQKSGYGVADGIVNELPHIVTVPGATNTLEEAKKEAIEYFKINKESKPKKPMTEESIKSETIIIAVPEEKKKTSKKPNTIHNCAVRLGRKGGLASAKVRAKMVDGGEVETATEIRNQLGQKALFMLGAYDIFSSKGDLVFKIKGSPHWKHIKIHLNPNDLYDITFTTWRKKDLSDIKDKTIKDIGAEQMHSIIEKETGLYTSLENGGPIPDDEDPHDGSDVSPDSTEYLIDMELKPLIDKVRKQAFMPDYQAEISDADVLGLIVSKYNRWNGDKIKETCVSVFEDANYHDAAEQVSKFEDGGPIEGHKYVTGIHLSDYTTDLPDGTEYGWDADMGEMVAYKGKVISAQDLPSDIKIIKIKKESSTESPEATCGCFHSFLSKENPELIKRLETEDVNSNPELRAQVDEAHAAWQGGMMNNGGGLQSSIEKGEKEFQNKMKERNERSSIVSRIIEKKYNKKFDPDYVSIYSSEGWHGEAKKLWNMPIDELKKIDKNNKN